MNTIEAILIPIWHSTANEYHLGQCLLDENNRRDKKLIKPSILDEEFQAMKISSIL
jgi:hypothetical protein